MFTVALIGALTAVFAATIALVQNDIKKVLAYSTVSQLGYMFLGVGVGAFTAGFFHVMTHAFFKACLFLGAGSVIHSMHKRIHDTDASQDMRNMGGMRKFMPYTFATFAMAWVAIIGVPFTAGFFSKDEILLKAYTSSIASPIAGGKMTQMTRSGQEVTVLELFQWPSWGNQLLFWLGAIGAIMTAFYMSRSGVRHLLGGLQGLENRQEVEGARPRRAPRRAPPRSERASRRPHAQEEPLADHGASAGAGFPEHWRWPAQRAPVPHHAARALARAGVQGGHGGQPRCRFRTRREPGDDRRHLGRHRRFRCRVLHLHSGEGRPGQAARREVPGPVPAGARQVARGRVLRGDDHRRGGLPGGGAAGSTR